HGTLALNSNGSFTYTPTTGYVGTDSFTYHAKDSTGLSSPIVSVTIQVIDLAVTSISPQTSASGQVLTNVTVNGSGFRLGAIPNPPGSVSFNGHNYLFVSTLTTWNLARDYCASLGGHLVTITSPAENTFVQNLAGAGDKWMGLTDSAVEGTFVWITGEPV